MHPSLHVRFARMLGALAGRTFAGRLRNPVFVVGVARSGTTIAADTLANHPRICNWSEANYVWDPDFYPWRGWRPQPRSVDRPLPLEYAPEDFTERWWQSMKGRELRVLGAFGAFQWLAGAEIFLNKSPFHTFRISHLLTLRPDARFIHVVRDGRAVCHSYGTRLVRLGKLNEWPRELQERFTAQPESLFAWLASFWLEGLRAVEHADREHRLTERGLLLTIRYEDLCARPASEIERALRFLGADIVEIPAELRQQNWKWRQELDGGVVATIEDLMREGLSRYGYR